MRWTSGLIAAVLSLLLAGCASAGSGSAGGPPPPTGTAANPAGSPSAAEGSPSASAAGEPSSAEGSPSAQAATCTTRACVVGELEQSLVGLVAKDGSVITKAVCYKSTVADNAGNTYTAQCDVTYSDDTVYSGYATLLVNSNQVSWEPTEELQ